MNLPVQALLYPEIKLIMGQDLTKTLKGGPEF